MKNLGKFKLTEEMLLNLLKGKTLNIVTIANDGEESQIEFTGPFEGMFITHEELAQIKYNSEMGVFNLIQRIQNEKSKSYKVQESSVE